MLHDTDENCLACTTIFCIPFGDWISNNSTNEPKEYTVVPFFFSKQNTSIKWTKNSVVRFQRRCCQNRASPNQLRHIITENISLTQTRKMGHEHRVLILCSKNRELSTTKKCHVIKMSKVWRDERETVERWGGAKIKLTKGKMNMLQRQTNGKIHKMKNEATLFDTTS